MRLQVVEQNGQWYCEYDGKTYPSMVRRYVTTLRCTDNTAELTLNAFNEQVSPKACVLPLWKHRWSVFTADHKTRIYATKLTCCFL